MSDVAQLTIFQHERWINCQFCKAKTFPSKSDFLRHVKTYHCTQEGGSFVCLYGHNNVCASLPLEGVSDKDLEEHVLKQHAQTMVSKGYSSNAKLKGNGVGEKWGVYSSTQNIPAVLHDPKRGIKRDFFTKTWGESFIDIGVVLDPLPTVTAPDFHSYVKKLRRRQKVLQQVAIKEAAKRAEEAENSECNPSVPGGLLNVENSIPSIFLSSSFSLQDPSTFYAVFTHITSSGVSKKNAKNLQEKLFHFLEIVESDMCRQISRKSSAFFDTMMYLNAQMEQLQINHKSVLNLRNEISHLRKEVVVEPLKVLSLPQRKANIVQCLRKLDLMTAVREVQATIQEMLARQEYSSALVLISTTQDLLRSELSSIKCLRNMSSELREHENLIDKIVTSEFSKYITEDLNRPHQDGRPLLEEDQLIRVVFGVLRLQKIDFLQNLRDEIEAAVNAVVKQAVAEAVSELEVDYETTSVVEQAKVLSIVSWLSLLSEVTKRLRVILERVKMIVGVIAQAVEASAGNCGSVVEGVQAASIVTMASSIVSEPILSTGTLNKAVSYLTEILISSCDYCHERCAKLLHARSRDQALDKMTVNEFLSLSRIIEEFVIFTEGVCGKMSISFRMGLQEQAVKFVSRFHEERESRLKYNLASERWKAVAIPPDIQDLVDHIFQSGSLEFPSVNNKIGGRATNGIVETAKDITTRSSVPDFNSKISLPSSKSEYNLNGPLNEIVGVRVGEQDYVIVGVCLVVVRLVVEYAECALTLRLASQQLLMRLTDLLKKFNADTCRLLVEAGAVNLGVRLISARNLALAWRSLQLILTILPTVTKQFSSLVKPEFARKQLDQVITDYESHCSAIKQKIISIAGNSLDLQLNTWEAKSPVPSQSFTNILKTLSTLHEVISVILTKDQVENIFLYITEHLKKKLQEQVVRHQVSSQGPQSWVVMSELTFYFNHLSSLGLKPNITQEEFLKQLWNH